VSHSHKSTILDRAVRQSYAEDEDKIHLRTYQDVEPHLEYAKKLRRADAEERGRFGKRPDFHRKMSVPYNVILMAAHKLGIPAGKVFDSEYSKQIWKELKSPEYKGFRTSCDKKI
jgi:hypothetical protein